MISSLMHKVNARAKDFGFTATDSIGMIPMGPMDASSPRTNIFGDYGSRTMEQIRDYEGTFIRVQEEQSQESKLLYDLLTNSISSTGLARTSEWKDQYHIPIGGVPFGADLWFLKIIRSY